MADMADMQEPVFPTERLADLRIHGAPYSHEGPCAGVACARCYKYCCPRCRTRSNYLMTCYICSTTAQLREASHSAPVQTSEAVPPPGNASAGLGATSAPDNS